ncbi:MAG TPA: NADH-quinone oxidoreductase subunit NuoG [Gammaproteobacteria bacterium]|nr:NADH-quinone oxidoreductase subunit NuoG [Gammaproteobacteria bacterium]
MSDNIKVTINGQEIETQPGRLLIDVADENNIVIPRFCYHKRLSVAANCRMCLVEIERAPKPMPACATHCMDGMVVLTRSQKALAAQKSTMEFLLINHPLDCPICDQGGECELQDVAMGFGEGVSKYTEQKRVVMDKNIGPLIATDFTRCIHCTRCIRFGDEIAGMPELGATGRGEFMEIGTYIEKAIVSELSGNVIDVCPVGALTAKPSRYTARPWELTQHAAVSAHDCVGSNTWVHTRGNSVMRVVPRENESINESWISDRDRFSYTSVNSTQRLLQPLLRENGSLQPVDWETALEAAADMMTGAGASLATLISPQATLEEQYLAQKLTRAQGSSNIDHRLTQVDFSAQQEAPIMPWLGRSLASLETLDAALIVAGNLRYQQPLLSHRLRKAVQTNKAAVSAIGHTAGQYNFALQHELAGSASRIVHDLAAVALSLAEFNGKALPQHLAKIVQGCEISDSHRAIARSLAEGTNCAVIVGSEALANPQLALLQEICEAITQSADATLGYLSDSANSAGACLAGALPHRGPAGVEVDAAGEHVGAIATSPHKLLITFGVNPLLDMHLASPLADSNESIIAISCFANEFIQEQANLVLPLAAVLESSGSFVNVEGLWQSFKGCVQSRGESRQGWKILAALGQLMHAHEFDYSDSLAVRNELKSLCSEVALSNLCGIKANSKKLPQASGPVERIGFTPIYACDDMTRLSAALQATPLMRMQASVSMNRQMAASRKLLDSEQVQIKQGKGTAVLPLRLDESVPDGCVYIPSGIDAVRHLTDAFGKISLEKVL